MSLVTRIIILYHTKKRNLVILNRLEKTDFKISKVEC